MEEYVCHCFGYTAADIVRDVEEHGASTILNRIQAAKAQGGCACKDKNPKGR
jgi:BFD-like [2Fe-2S] binding domain.